MKEKTN